jgi:hypothetical protein
MPGQKEQHGTPMRRMLLVVRMLYAGRYRRHTGPELDTGGMRGSKPAEFSDTGE